MYVVARSFGIVRSLSPALFLDDPIFLKSWFNNEDTLTWRSLQAPTYDILRVMLLLQNFNTSITQINCEIGTISATPHAPQQLTIWKPINQSNPFLSSITSVFPVFI